MRNVSAVILINPFLTSIAFDVIPANDAKSMIQKAAAFIKAKGKEKAIAEFNNPHGEFIDRDLYIFVVDFKGIILADSANAKRVGQNMLGLKDANGKLLFPGSPKPREADGWIINGSPRKQKRMRINQPISKRWMTISSVVVYEYTLFIAMSYYKQIMKFKTCVMVH